MKVAAAFSAVFLAVLAYPVRAQEPVTVGQEGVAAQQAQPRTPRELEELRGDIFMARKQYTDAVNVYQGLVRQEPRNARLLNKLGIAYHQQNVLNLAKRYYERATKADKAFPFAHNNLGMVDYNRGKYKNSLKHFKKALELDPTLASVESNLGHSYFRMKKYEEAFTAFGRALAIDPEVFERRPSSSGSLLQDRSVEDRSFYFFFLAKTFAAAGNAERCAYYLEKARDEGYKLLADVPKDPAFASVISDKRVLDALASQSATSATPRPRPE